MIFILFIIFTASCSITEAFESSDEKVVEKYLSEYYGFDKETDKLNDAVKDIQQGVGITEDGKITKELLAHIGKSRCGVKLSDKKSKRYDVFDIRWDKGVTYRFYIHGHRHPRTMSAAAIRRAITIGVQYWSTVADIYFNEISETSGAMFSISFEDAVHMTYDVHHNFAQSIDPANLDNVPYGVLAHAYSPRHGNLHLDSAEIWTEGTDDGINLRFVVAHEMGHAIGLDHSQITKAVMYPFYSGYVSEGDFKLPDDDSQGAIFLYGPKPGFRFVRSENNNRERSENENSLCNSTNIKAAFEYTDGHIYVVSDDNTVFRLVNYTIDSDFKTFKLQRNLQNADAILFDNSALRLVVFKGNTIFSSSGLSLDKLSFSQLNITHRGAFQGKVTAAFARDRGDKRSQRFWAVQDGQLISGNIKGSQVRFSDRTTKWSAILKMSGGGNIPPSIDGALITGRKHSLRLVLFIGNSVYIGIPKGRKNAIYTIPAEYPKTFKDLINC